MAVAARFAYWCGGAVVRCTLPTQDTRFREWERFIHPLSTRDTNDRRLHELGTLQYLREISMIPLSSRFQAQLAVALAVVTVAGATPAASANVTSVLSPRPSGAATATVDCAATLSDLAARIAPNGGHTVIIKKGTRKAWKWSDGEWVIGSFRGFYYGGTQDPPTGDIWVWPSAHKGISKNPCTPSALAKLFKTLAHETFHGKCPPHAPPEGGTPEFPPDPENPPEFEGDPPDCNDLNYQANTGQELCEEIGDAGACLSDPECPGLTDEEGNVIPGLEHENLEEYCEGLSDEYDALQEITNTEENAQTAFGCNCGDPPWSPDPDEYPDCPVLMDQPPAGGCAGDAGDAYPENKVIPDCEASCE